MALFALITGGLGQDVTRLLTLGLGIGEDVTPPEIAQDPAFGNWYRSAKRKRAFALPQKWTDDERRILRGLPPVAVEIARKKAKEAAQAQASATEAMRLSVEALRQEVGKQKAAELRDDFVFIVRTMVEREVIELAKRQAIAEEEEAIAMLSMMLAVA